MSPIFLEYYTHTKSMCYKIDLPWTLYARDTLTLCEESDGWRKAKKLARKAMIEHIDEALDRRLSPQTGRS